MAASVIRPKMAEWEMRTILSLGIVVGVLEYERLGRLL